MGRVADDLKNKSFAPVYLIYGKEPYLMEFAKNSLKKALVAPGDNLNYVNYAGGSTDPAQVVSMAYTLPFMAEKRVIMVTDSGFFKKSVDEITAYIKEPSEDTVLIFCESQVDERTSTFKAAKAGGYLSKEDPYSEDKLKKWIGGNLKRYGKQVTEEAVDLLLERTGAEMTALDNEVAKLVSYVGDRGFVNGDDVKKLVHRNPTLTVFNMIDAISLRQVDRAVGCYYDMIAEKESPFAILTHMERTFRSFIVLKDLAGSGLETRELAQRAGCRDFLVSRYIQRSKKYTYSRLMGILDACAEADRDIKQGRIADELAVELLIVELASEPVGV